MTRLNIGHRVSRAKIRTCGIYILVKNKNGKEIKASML